MQHPPLWVPSCQLLVLLWTVRNLSLVAADCTSQDVRNAYTEVLCRQPDTPGFDYWVGECEKNPSISKNTLLAALRNSDEYLDCDWLLQNGKCTQNCQNLRCNNQDIKNAFQEVLCRVPDNDGLSYWTGQCSTGAMHRDKLFESLRDGEEYAQCPHLNTAGKCYSDCQKTCTLDELKVTYRDVLCREPDADGQAYWMNACKTDPYIHTDKLEAAIKNSDEYRNCPWKDAAGKCYRDCLEKITTSSTTRTVTTRTTTTVTITTTSLPTTTSDTATIKGTTTISSITSTVTTVQNDGNVNCVETQDKCTSACESGGARNYIVTVLPIKEGNSCKGPSDCRPGDGACPLTTTTTTTVRASTSAAASSADATIKGTTTISSITSGITSTVTTVQNDGNVNCVETQDKCTSACESGGARNYIVTVLPIKEGNSCKGPSDCRPGDGACPLTTTTTTTVRASTSAAASSADESDDGKQGMSGGAIAGLILGLLLLVVLIILAARLLADESRAIPGMSNLMYAHANEQQTYNVGGEEHPMHVQGYNAVIVNNVGGVENATYGDGTYSNTVYSIPIDDAPHATVLNTTYATPLDNAPRAAFSPTREDGVGTMPNPMYQTAGNGREVARVSNPIYRSAGGTNNISSA